MKKDIMELTKVLEVLKKLSDETGGWFEIRDCCYYSKLNMRFIIDYYVTPTRDHGRVVIDNYTCGESVLEIWTDTQDAEDDGERIHLRALEEYLRFILKEEYNR